MKATKIEKERMDIYTSELYEFIAGEISYETMFHNICERWRKLDELHLFHDDKEKVIE